MLDKALIINFPSSEKDFRLPIVKFYLKDTYIVDIIINPIWGNYKTKFDISKNPLLAIQYVFKEFSYLVKLLFKIYKNEYSLIIIGYPAYIEALFLKIFASQKIKKTTYIDFFISIYDTLVLDRKLIPPHSIKAKVFYFFDKRLLKSSNQLLVDTKKNVDRYAVMFGINRNNFIVLFVGSNNLITNPYFENKSKQKKSLNIGWVGAVIPLHGIEEIIKSALIVKDENINFHLIGNGPNNELELIKYEIVSLGLTNILLYNELDFESTMVILNNCDICLGIFGKSEKSKAVIPFKIFDYLYLNKPIITQYSDAIMEISDFDQIYKVENNAIAIAEQIFKVDINKSNSNQNLLKRTLKEQYKKIFLIN